MSSRLISVPEISCAACKTAIEGALAPLDGVSRAVVDVAAKRVRVDYDQSRISPERLVAAIEEQGYQVAGKPPSQHETES